MINLYKIVKIISVKDYSVIMQNASPKPNTLDLFDTYTVLHPKLLSNKFDVKVMLLIKLHNIFLMLIR